MKDKETEADRKARLQFMKFHDKLHFDDPAYCRMVDARGPPPKK